jgi:hypothetical protein
MLPRRDRRRVRRHAAIACSAVCLWTASSLHAQNTTVAIRATTQRDPCESQRAQPSLNLDTANQETSERSSQWTIHPLAVEAFGSMGGRHSTTGAGIDWSPSTGVGLRLGGGWSAQPGSAMGELSGRIRLLLSRYAAAGTEAGFIVDRYEASEGCSAQGCRQWKWSTAVWGKIGVHVEARTSLGLTLRLSAGASSIFNMITAACSGCPPGQAPGLWTYSLPYFSLAAGWVLL